MHLVHAGIWAIAAVTAPAAGQRSELDAQQAPLFGKAATELQSGQPAQALETIAPAIVAYERAYAGEKRRVYCGISPTQTVAAMLLAAKDRKDAIAVGEGYCTALYVRAFTLVDVGRVDEAEAAFGRLVELAPFNARYVYELANTRRTTKRYDLALEGYRKAADLASLAPDGREKIERAAAWRQIGWIFVEQGKWDAAEEIYRQCLTLDPNDQKAKNELDYIAEHRPKKA